MITKNIVPGSIRASVRGMDLKVKERLRYLWANDGSRKFEVIKFNVSGTLDLRLETVSIRFLTYQDDNGEN